MMSEAVGMRKKYDGQITVFVALLFMVVVSLFMAQYRSALFYTRRADAQRAARLSTESLLAQYVKPLRDYYQILALDGGFGTSDFSEESIENILSSVFSENYRWASEVSLEDIGYTLLIDSDWDFFLREISLNRMDGAISGGLTEILSQWRTKNESASEDLSQKLNEAASRADSENKDSEDKDGADKDSSEIRETVTDPRDFVMELWNQGILKAACPEDFSVSEKRCDMTGLSFPEAGQRIRETVDFKAADTVQALMGKWDGILEPGNGILEVAEDGAALMYIQEVFTAASPGEAKIAHERVLDYEVEYIIGGNESDSENLKTVLWKLLAFRSVMNLSHILMSSEKSMQVEHTAAALSTALMIPQFIEVVAFLLKSAWAFAEALSDCRTLLKGGRIPLMKSSEDWYLTWEQMLSLDGGVLDGNEGKSGVDYDGYMQMLLLLTKRDVKYRRMTHLMEQNIRQMPEYTEFRMDHCLYGIQAVFRCDLGYDMTGDIQTALSY